MKLFLWQTRPERSALVAGLLFVALLLLWLWVGRDRTLAEQEAVFGIIEAIVTTAALVVGAYWAFQLFFLQRESVPRVNVHQDIEKLELADGRTLLKVSARLENISKVEVHLQLWCLRADRLLPLSDDSRTFLEGRSAFSESEAPWETRAGHSDGEFGPPAFNVRLEPGEVDWAVGYLVIPSGLEVVQIYSHFKLNRDHSRPGWPCLTLMDLRTELQKEQLMSESKTPRSTPPPPHPFPDSDSVSHRQQDYVPVRVPGGQGGQGGDSGNSGGQGGNVGR